MNATPALRGAPAHRRPHASVRQLVVAVLILVLAAQAAVVTWWALRGPSSYAGQVQAAHGVDLNFPTSGRLISVRVAPGDHVHRGETLARQDPAAAQSGLDAAQAVLAADQARLAALEAPSVGTAQAQQQALQVAQANAALAGAQSALADARSVASDSVASAVTAVQSAQAAVTGEQSQLAVLCPNGVQPLPANPTPAEVAQFTSCSNLQAQVQRDSSALAAAQANLPGVEAQAQQEVDRASSAVSASQVSLSLAQNQAVLSTAPASAADIAQAEAVVAADQAQIAADRQTLRSLTLVAPFDATVTSVGGASGDLAGSTGVQLFGGLPAINASAPSFSLFPQTPASSSTTTPPANLPLFSLEEPRSHEVVAQVPEDDISKFTRGTRVHVAVNALGVTLGGRVLAVSATPLRSQGPPVLYQVAVRVHDAPRDMISGMSVAVRLDGR